MIEGVRKYFQIKQAEGEACVELGERIAGLAVSAYPNEIKRHGDVIQAHLNPLWTPYWIGTFKGMSSVKP